MIATVLHDWTGWEWLWRAVLIALAAVFTAHAWTLGIRYVWVLGMDARRRLSHTVAPVRFALLMLAWSGLMAVRWVDDMATSVLISLAITVLATVWGHRFLREAIAGVMASSTRSFVVGDHIAIEDVAGTVLFLGLTRAKVRTSAGEILDIPATRLMRSVLRSSSEGSRALPVEVVAPLRPAMDHSMALGLLKDEALLSPYTDPATRVIVELVGLTSARIQATPRHPDDNDALRSDLLARAARLAAAGFSETEEPDE